MSFEAIHEAVAAEIAGILRHRKGPQGDTFALERDREGPHGSIMKYNLSRQVA